MLNLISKGYGTPMENGSKILQKRGISATIDKTFTFSKENFLLKKKTGHPFRIEKKYDEDPQ